MYAQEGYSSKYRPLSEIIPAEIDWVPSVLLAAALNVTERQLRYDVSILKRLELVQLHEIEREIQFADPDPNTETKRKRIYKCRRKGFDRADAEIIWLFRQVVRKRGRVPAIKAIYTIIQEFYNASRRTESGRRS